MKDLLDTLPPREVRVLQLRFGLYGTRQHTLNEVGQKMGITRERVRQIQNKALEKVRVFLEENARGPVDGIEEEVVVLSEN